MQSMGESTLKLIIYPLGHSIKQVFGKIVGNTVSDKSCVYY